jgi:hypothetical protein
VVASYRKYCDVIADAGKSLEIFGILVLRSHERIWCAFPGLPIIGADDRVLRDDRGKVRYKIGLKWSDRSSGDKFSAFVIAAITAQYGEIALGGES